MFYAKFRSDIHAGLTSIPPMEKALVICGRTRCSASVAHL